MAEICNIWFKHQNKLNHYNHDIFSNYQDYYFYVDKVKVSWHIGAWCYYWGDDYIRHLKRGRESGVPRIFHCFNWSFTLEEDPHLKVDPLMSVGKDLFEKMKIGKLIIEPQLFETLHYYIVNLKRTLTKHQKFVVFFPNNPEISDDIQKRIFSKLLKILRFERIPYIMGDIDKVQNPEKQLVVLVVDSVTTKERMHSVITSISSHMGKFHPLFAYFSLFKNFDKEECQFRSISQLSSIDNERTDHIPQIKTQKHIKKIVIKEDDDDNGDDDDDKVIYTRHYDDEASIMRSLAGYGADPEIYGF